MRTLSLVPNSGSWNSAHTQRALNRIRKFSIGAILQIMNNWQQSQQWGTTQQSFGQPQQGQGWGQHGGMGGWQQAAAPSGQGFFNPRQQQQLFPVQHHQASFPPNQGEAGGGFMAGPAGGGGHVGAGFPMNQGMGGQGQFGGFPQHQQAHQQQQFQAMQQQQQQQQMAYIQEQQRLAKEEQKKRDLEIQKRKLMNINVAKPTAPSSLSFDDLVSIKPSSSPRSSPKVTRQTQDVAVQPKTTAPVAVVTQKQATARIDNPVPTQSSQTTSSDSNQSVQATPTVSSGNQNNSAPSAKQPDNTFEKLMESSLSNLRDTSPSRSRRVDFKSSKSGAKSSPLTSAQQKAFSQSMRARAWTADGGNFSGVFTQHVPQQQQQQQAADLLGGGDDSFGEFQSVGVVGGVGAAMTSLIEPLGQSQGAQLVGLQQDLQPKQQIYQGQPPIVGSGDGRSMAHEQTRVRAATVHGSNTIPTSAYQHPISSTSVAQKSQSPTGTQFSNLDPSKFPPVYVEVLKRCCKPGEVFMDTGLLFPLLMSSQLPKNVLRDLWSVANREIPGKLNQTELFVLLGLIGLAQSGNPSPKPEDLKKASKLPIPNLSALQETLPSVSAQVPSSSQSHAHAPPTDDFGDFQHGQQSFQPSIPPPPPSSDTAQPRGNPPTGDKYSVFDDLHSISSSEATSMPPSNITSSSKAAESAPPQLPLATTIAAAVQGGGTSLSVFQAATTMAPTVSKSDDFGSFSSVPLPSSSSQSQDGLLAFTSSASSAAVPPSDGGGFADFASFQQAPTSGSTGLGPAEVAAPEVGNSTQGWAAFGDFTSSQATSHQDTSFPPPPPSSTLPAISSSNVVKTKAADSAFDSLLPPELLPSKAPKSAQPEPKSVKATLFGSLESKPSVTTTAALDFSIFESDLSPESKKKAKKQLTGLEVLEEEFSARRVSAKVASVSAPLTIEEPLAPESAPLDDFGEFEAYSSAAGVDDKKTSLPLADLSASAGEPSPSLKKKSSTDPLQVWSSCLFKCSEVLESCVGVFSEVKEQTVLEEIAQSKEGRNKLKGIVEVYRLAKRVYRPFREKKEGAEGESCVQSIQKQWKKLINLLPNSVMTELYTETTPACVEEEDVLSDSISKCSLCLTSKSVSIPPHLSLDGKKEEYTLSLLFNSGQSYHSTCANFWLNVVQEELPLLI